MTTIFPYLFSITPFNNVGIFCMKLKKLLLEYKDAVSSIDSIVDALYDVISGDRGEARDCIEKEIFFIQKRD